MPTLTQPLAPAVRSRIAKPKKFWTDEEILALPDDCNKYEVVDGELVTMPPAFPEHGECSASLSSRVAAFVRARKLGKTFDNQTGFRMKFGNLRSPDFSFLSNERLRLTPLVSRTFYGGAPDLCVEVHSSDERPSYIKKKLSDYFESGARLVWWLYPATKTVRVYRDAVNFKLLGIGDALDGEDVLPGFRLSLKKLFAD